MNPEKVDNSNSTALLQSSLQAESSTGGAATEASTTRDPSNATKKRAVPSQRKENGKRFSCTRNLSPSLHALTVTKNYHSEENSSQSVSSSDSADDDDSEDHGQKPLKKRSHQARKHTTLPRSRNENMNSSKARPPPKFIIQEWHVVLGDTHARSDRTTKATELLRRVKDQFKKDYKGEKKSDWIPLAIREFHKRLENELFPPSKHPEAPREELGLVLVRCTPKSMDRVAEPYLYGYKGDAEALFGIAQAKQALEFFLVSRDAPNLAHELERHSENLKQLRQSEDSPPVEMMDDFQNTLDFFQSKLARAEDESALATSLLECLKPINPLKEQWKVLMAHKKPISIRGTNNPASTKEKGGKANKASGSSANECKNDTSVKSRQRNKAKSSEGETEDAKNVSATSKTPPLEGNGSPRLSSKEESKPPVVSKTTSEAALVPSTPNFLLGTDDIGMSQRHHPAALLYQMRQQKSLSVKPEQEGSNVTSEAAVRSLDELAVSRDDSFRWHKNAPVHSERHSDPSQGLASQHRDTPLAKRTKQADPEPEETKEPAHTDGNRVQSQHPQLFYNSNVVSLQRRMFMTQGFFPYPFFRDDVQRHRGA